MGTLTAIDRDEALRITRDLEDGEVLPGAVLRPMAGSTIIEFRSLAEVEWFLMPVTAEELSDLGVRAEIHHLDPRTLVAWVRDVIGDPELAAGLQAVVESERPYGLLVPEIKQLLAERISQCEAVLAEEPMQ